MLRKISAISTKASIKEVFMKHKQFTKARTVNHSWELSNDVLEKVAFVIISRNVANIAEAADSLTT